MRGRIVGRKSVAAALLLACTGLLSAGELEAAPRGLKGKRALRLFEQTTASCRRMKVHDEVELVSDEPGANGLTVKRLGKTLQVSVVSSGSGVHAQHYTAHWQVDVARCRAIGVSASSVDGQLTWPMKLLRDGRAAPSAREQVSLLVQAGYAIARGKKPAFGAAVLMASAHRCGEPKEGPISGAMVSEQRSYAGKPRQSGMTAFVGPKKTIAVSWVGKPRVVKRAGRYTIYAGRLGGRSTDQALAVYDEKRKRHRWLLQTRACSSGKLSWLGGRGDVLVVKTTPTHPVWRANIGESLLFLQLAKGAAHRLILAAPASLNAKIGPTEIDVTLSREGAQPTRLKLPWKMIERRL